MLLFRTLRVFGKGVSEKAFHAEVPWGVLFCSGGKKERTQEHKARTA